MQKSLIIFLIIIIISAFSFSAQAQEEEIKVYTVQKGDTLWSISYDNFDDYFLWPRLWNFNPHISNPDFIYPGTIVRIPSREVLLQIPAAPKVKRKPSKPTVVFNSPYKPQNYIINKELYITSGWISKTYPAIGELKSSPTERELVGNGDIVYLKFIEPKKSKKVAAATLVIKKKKPEDHGLYFSIRNIKTVIHPETGRSIGYQIRITGVVESIGKDNDVIKARITETFEDIQIGDGLIPYMLMEPPVDPRLVSTPDIEGYVIESHMNSRILGKSDIIYLDKGTEDGINVGDFFSAISESKIKRSIGTIQVISVQPTTSAAYIQESQTEITVGSMWGLKR